MTTATVSHTTIITIIGHPTDQALFVTTNHKDIGDDVHDFRAHHVHGGGAMIMGVRAGVFQPGMQLMQPEFFHS